MPLGYLPDSPEDIGGFLQADSNYSTQPPYATSPPQFNPDLEAQRIAILEHFTLLSLCRGQHPCRKVVFTIKSHDQGWGGDRSHKGTYRGSFTWFQAGVERLEIYPGEFIDLPLVGEMAQKTTEGNGPPLSGIPYTIRTIEPATVPSANDPKIYKFEHPDHGAPATCLQRNKTATPETHEHVVTWSYDDSVDPESEEGQALEEAGRGRASATGEFVRNLNIGDIVTVWACARFPGWQNVVEDVKIDLYWAV